MINLNDLIEVSAPHGSGIDFDYTNIKINSKGKISFENAFHLMDSETGMYIAVIPFRITIDKLFQLKIQFIGLNYTGWNIIKNYYWLRDDLYDIYNQWLEQYKMELIDVFNNKQ